MYLKLAIKNMQRSLKNYVVYFMTILIVVSLMYGFLALACSPDILSLSDNMEAFRSSVILMTGTAAVMISYVVGYAADFIISQRKKEFAIYSLLGIERRYINRMFYIENLIIYIIAMVSGVVLGSILAGALSGKVLDMFEIPHKYQVSVSMTPVLYTVIFCCLMQIITNIRIINSIKNRNIVDLLYDAQKNEKAEAGNMRRLKYLFIFAAFIFGAGIYLIYYGLTCNMVSYWIYIAVGILFLFFSVCQVSRLFPILITGRSKHFKRCNYMGKQVFLLRQISSRMNSAGRLMSVVAICLTVAMAIMSAGMAVGAGYKKQIERYAPYDIAVRIDADISDFDMELEYIGERVQIRDYVDYKLYETAEYPGLAILAFSDYNRIRKQKNLESVHVEADSYVIHCDWDFKDQIVRKLEDESGMIQLGDFSLKPMKDGIRTEVMEQRWMVGINGYAIIVPDIIAGELPTKKSRLIVTTETEADKSLKHELMNVVSEHLTPLVLGGDIVQQTTIGILVQSWTRANSLTGYTILWFCSMYLGIVFIILICTLLGFRQLSTVADSKRNYILLWKLGFSAKEIERLILKEMLVFFFIPIIMPVVVTVSLMTLLNKIYMTQMAEANLIIHYASLSVTLFMIIYTVYFVITFVVYRKIVLPKMNK